VEVPTGERWTRLLDRVSFDVYPHEVLGIVGESGSGKSMTMLAVMGLLPSPIRMVGGQVQLFGEDIAGLSFDRMRAIRGRRISMIFQDPMTSLNPVLRIADQIGEAIALHQSDMPSSRIRSRIVDLLELVGIPDAARRANQFPHEFSGGMRQRAMIAMAIANDPALLIADEPTTALDVTIQAQVMEVLAHARARTGAAMILITHDLGLVADSANRVAVMYGGRIVEESTVEKVFRNSRHPYTAGLLASLPRIDRRRAELYSIPGQVSDLRKQPSGCTFHPRCGLGGERKTCIETLPELIATGDNHRVACHFWQETAAWAQREAEDNRSQIVAPIRAHDAKDTRTGRRVGMRQVHAWPSDSWAARCHVRLGHSQGAQYFRHEASHVASASPTHAGGISRSLRFTRPPTDGGRDHRRAVAYQPDVSAGTCDRTSERSRSRTRGSAQTAKRVFRRTATAHRNCTRSRAQPRSHGPGRSCVGARRLDPGPSHQSSEEAAGEIGTRLFVHFS